MTTYAYPITLYEYRFKELQEFLKKLCDESEAEGRLVYDPETRRPIGTFANILEIMKETKDNSPKVEEQFAPTITFTLTDYLFIPLENLLKEKCQQYKDQTGNNPFDPITGEAQLNYASMLEATRFASKNSLLNSRSSFVGSIPIKLWSPKRSTKD
jgi:hypothetical protein